MLEHLISILALATSSVARGSVIQPPESDLILGADTITMLFNGNLALCPHTSAFYSVAAKWPTEYNVRSHDWAVEGLMFPDTSEDSLSAFRSGYAFLLTSPCDGKFSYSAASSKFLMQGESKWAIWMDSAWAITKPVDRSGLMIRWRWVSIADSAGWVRWIDTMSIPSDGRRGGPVPLFSTVRAIEIDSVVPESRGPNPPGLSLRRDASQTASLWRIGSPLDQKNPWGSFTKGTTIYVDGATGSSLWRIWSQGTVIDSFWIHDESATGTRPVRRNATDGLDRSWLPNGIPTRSTSQGRGIDLTPKGAKVKVR